MTKPDPLLVRLSDPVSAFFLYGVAGIGGVGIIVYQAVIWFLYTTFNYMSLEWLFQKLKLPFFVHQSSWYNHPQQWLQFHDYFVLFCQWMPLSISLMILGKGIGGWIDGAAMDYGRRRSLDDDARQPGKRGLGS